jgi:hypothetical protein
MRRRWGKRDSLHMALACGGLDVALGLLSHDLQGILAVVAFLGAATVLVLQWGGRSRPFTGVAWFCLEASLLAMTWVDLTEFLRGARR